MKLRYLFASLVATLALFASCSEEFEPTLLDEIQVSNSIVAIPQSGGSTSFEVTAKGPWELICCDSCEVLNSNHMVKGASKITEEEKWLNGLQFSATKGEAGKTTVTVTSGSTLDGRSHYFKIHCEGATQIITIMQGLPTVSEATVAEVMAGPDSKTYQVKGIVTKIAETVKYGNFYINDGTSDVDLYIYGTKYEGKTEQAALEKLGVEVGDEIIVSGPKTTYKETVELVDVDVIKLNKSLIKVASVDPENGTLPTDGGDFTVVLSNKGQGVTVEVPEDAKSWLSLKSVNGNTVVFHATENNAGPRATTLKFKTTDGKKDYSCETSLSQEGKAGTLDLPMTVAEAIAAAKAGVTNSVYVKGVVSKVVSGGYGAKYGNGTFWISSDGTSSVSEDGKTTADTDHDFEVYRATWFGNEKWTDGNAQIAEGAEVVIYGALTLYNGIAETSEGKAYVYSVNGVTTDANGIGTEAAPFNCVGGIQAAQAKIASKVFVHGIVSELVKGGFDPNYGNGSFWMSDNGSKAGDLALDFEAYQVNYLGGAKWTEDQPQIAVGDDVVIYGPLTTYNGTSETQGKGAAYVYSLNGKTE